MGAPLRGGPALRFWVRSKNQRISGDHGWKSQAVRVRVQDAAPGGAPIGGWVGFGLGAGSGLGAGLGQELVLVSGLEERLVVPDAGAITRLGPNLVKVKCWVLVRLRVGD